MCLQWASSVLVCLMKPVSCSKCDCQQLRTHGEMQPVTALHTFAQAVYHALFNALWRHYTGLFEMIVGVLTTCHTQYT